MKVLAPVILFLLSITKGYAQNPDSSTTSGAKVAPWFVERFKVSAGFFLPVNNTDLKVGIKGNPGTDINLEKDLGFNKDIGTFLAGLQWRISRRSRINFNYYNIRRNSVHTLDKDITFKDSTYHVGATVDAFFNTAIYQFSYGYSILSKPRYEVGVMIGAHMVGASSGISVKGMSTGFSGNSDFGFTAPLPDLGVWGGYAFSDRWAVNGDFDYLALTVGDISGSILAYNVFITYKLLAPLDISLGYSGLNFNVDATKKNVTGHFEWSYNGPSLTATFNFGKKTWVH